MPKSVPITAIAGVELIPTQIDGISRVVVSETNAARDLSWDRFVRLKAVAQSIKECTLPAASILDAGGFDGALALFLPEYKIDLLDPATTGGSLLETGAPSHSYDLIASVDVLEHIAPDLRIQALKEITRVARRFIVLNYPHKSTKAAQKLVLEQTNNSLIRDHVQWDLPDANDILRVLSEDGFAGTVCSHASVAVWLGQYLSSALSPEGARELNRYLIEHHADEPFSEPLYELILCERTAG